MKRVVIVVTLIERVPKKSSNEGRGAGRTIHRAAPTHCARAAPSPQVARSCRMRRIPEMSDDDRTGARGSRQPSSPPSGTSPNTHPGGNFPQPQPGQPRAGSGGGVSVLRRRGTNGPRGGSSGGGGGAGGGGGDGGVGTRGHVSERRLGNDGARSGGSDLSGNRRRREGEDHGNTTPAQGQQGSGARGGPGGRTLWILPATSSSSNDP